jgi:hypothetical protein
VDCDVDYDVGKKGSFGEAVVDVAVVVVVVVVVEAAEEIGDEF